MYNLHLLENIKAIVDPLVLDIAIPEAPEKTPNYIPDDLRKLMDETGLGRLMDETQVRKLMDETEQGIVLPILESRTENLEHTIDSSIIPFNKQLNQLNRIMFTGRESKGDMLTIAKTENLFFDVIRRIIMMNKVDTNIYDILALWQKLWRYDNVVLGIAYTEPTLLEDVLSVTNIDVLRSYVSGGMLVFLCILSFLSDHLADFHKLRELIRIDIIYTDGLQSWVDGIYVLRKPEKYEKATYEIEGDIGLVKPGGFEINLDKMDTGRSYFFNYGDSKYKARKINGELQLVEIG